MSSYPPPPQPDQQHYNPIYDAGSNSQPLLDPEQQEQLHLATLSHATDYSKDEHTGLDPTTSSQLEQRFEQFQHQQSLENGQLHHHDLQSPHDTGLPLHEQPQSQPANGTAPNKLFRLRKACDSCSIRKVKCDEAGPPCKACAALDIPCTFDRPSRRRGPPNRHAEAVKRRRLDEERGSPQLPAPSSPTHAAQALAALSSHPATASSVSTEAILPIETIDLLLNDYFAYIHPIIPFPHEPSFREAWRRREDLTNRPFLALLASMLAALAASFPTKLHPHLRSQHKERLLTTPSELVRTCFKVCAEARGPGYLHSENLTVHDAATSYLLGIAADYSGHTKEGCLYIGECLTIINVLGLNKAKDETSSFGPNVFYGAFPEDANKDTTHDNITLQVGRRVFWTAFVTTRSMTLLGLPGEKYIPPSTPSEPYPPFPLEVEDFCIFPTHIESQPAGLVPNLAAFNANVRIFLAYQPLTIMELAWGINQAVDWEQQKSTYHECLVAVRGIMDQLPEELRLIQGDGGPGEANDTFAAFQLKMGLRDTNLLSIDESSPEQRRAIQHGIQRANIHTSALATLSYIVEKFWSAHESQSKKNLPETDGDLDAETRKKLGRLIPPEHGEVDIEGEMAAERDNIARGLLTLLSTLDRDSVEPNGTSLSHKIRFIATALIDIPEDRKTSVGLQADSHLRAFADIVARLARTRTDADAQVNGDGQQDAETRLWADMRDTQARFAQSGGVAGLA